MPALVRRIHGFFNYLLSGKDKAQFRTFKLITGRRPNSLVLYNQAMRHVSVLQADVKNKKESYERLEYLGDAILGMVVAEMLFKRFPFKDEGFLTELRSKIVNRESLNNLSKKIGLKGLVQYHKHRGAAVSHKSVYGDSLEALVGAIYLDQNFRFCKKFITQKLIEPHFDFMELASTTTNYKSKLIEWAQKESKAIRFDIVQSNEPGKDNQFIAQVYVEEVAVGIGYGFSKKKAEQEAAQKSIELLNIE